jgi:16S rRNA (guanine1207-N2)-methyltransferase
MSERPEGRKTERGPSGPAAPAAGAGRTSERPEGRKSERPDQHYFSATPQAPSQPSSLRLDLPDVSFSLAADRGVFSARQVDPGTKVLLLDAPPPPPAGDLLDLGCGYGPIALTLAVRSPAATVWAVDVNERALALTRANAAAAGLGNVRAVAPEEVPDEVRFAAIWSNPPIRIGKPALHDLLSRWLGRLADDGHALLVVQKHLGADSLHRWLEQQGWPVTRRASRMGYRVLELQR